MNLANNFLVSTSASGPSLFAGGVIYLCRHDDEGAFGLVINKPSKTSAAELLKALDVKASAPDKNKVLRGGPVKPEQVFILHSPPQAFDVTIKIGEHVGVTLSRDILTAISENRAPEKLLFAFGYAGWGKGQLEEEIAGNMWISLPATPDLIFDTPFDTRLTEAGRRLGFDINNLSGIAGHA